MSSFSFKCFKLAPNCKRKHGPSSRKVQKSNLIVFKPTETQNLCQKAKQDLQNRAKSAKETAEKLKSQSASDVLALQPSDEDFSLLAEDLALSDSDSGGDESHKPPQPLVADGSNELPIEKSNNPIPAKVDNLVVSATNTQRVVAIKSQSRLPSELLQEQKPAPNNTKRRVQIDINHQSNNSFKRPRVSRPPEFCPSPTHRRFNPGLYNVQPLIGTTNPTIYFPAATTVTINHHYGPNFHGQKPQPLRLQSNDPLRMSRKEFQRQILRNPRIPEATKARFAAERRELRAEKKTEKSKN